MRIATWNVERLSHKRKLDEILLACEQTAADILVLTESDECIRLNYRHSFHTPTPPDLYLPQYDIPLHYGETEHRISFFTNYECVRLHPTFDEHTALCVEVETECGNLLIYGTIMGILGNREASFKKGLAMQVEDFRRLYAEGHSLCVLGDYNCSFADNYYYTAEGRGTLLRSFAENRMALVTGKQLHCIDHIAISEKFLMNAEIQISEWNLDKKLSDHKGIQAELIWDTNFLG